MDLILYFRHPNPFALKFISTTLGTPRSHTCEFHSKFWVVSSRLYFQSSISVNLCLRSSTRGQGESTRQSKVISRTITGPSILYHPDNSELHGTSEHVSGLMLLIFSYCQLQIRLIEGVKGYKLTDCNVKNIIKECYVPLKMSLTFETDV